MSLSRSVAGTEALKRTVRQIYAHSVSLQCNNTLPVLFLKHYVETKQKIID